MTYLARLTSLLFLFGASGSFASGCAQSFELLSSSDAGIPDDHAALANGCAAQDAHDNPCRTNGDCTATTRYAWNGERCLGVSTCLCAGVDCDATYATSAECYAAYSNCLPAACAGGACEGRSEQDLCAITGGSFNGGDCGHPHCGVPSPLACASGGCNCGPTKNFVAGRGCVEDPACAPTEGEVCDASDAYPCRGTLACCCARNGATCVGPSVCGLPYCSPGDESSPFNGCGPQR